MILLNPSLVHYSSAVCIEPAAHTRALHLLVHRGRSRDDEEADIEVVITFPSPGKRSSSFPRRDS